MIQRQTWVNITDNTNIIWSRVFHLYKGFYRKKTQIGFFIKGSARIVTPPRLEYKGFKFKYYRKGDIIRMLLVRQKYNINKPDLTVLYTNNNNVLIIKKKQDTQSKYFFGPAIKQLKRKRFLLLFKKVI